MLGKGLVGVAVSATILGAIWISKDVTCLWAFIFLPHILRACEDNKGDVEEWKIKLGAE